MKKALMLGAVVSLVSAAAFAADDKKYWEARDANPVAADDNVKRDKHYWEHRDAQPALADDNVKRDKRYWEHRETNPKVESVGSPAVEAAPAAGQKPQAAAEKGPVRRAVERAADGAGRAGAAVGDAASDVKEAAKRVVAPLTPVAEPRSDKVGIAVEAGGGVGGFVDERMSSQTTAQGQWAARAVFGTRRHLAGEAAYVGSAQGVNTLGVSNGAKLVGNGGETALRFNLLTGMWQPYATAGVGFMHYTLGNAQLTTSDVQPTGDVATFPLGVGAAWRNNGVVLDGRVSFHPATTSGILRYANLSTWDVNAKAGFEF